MDSYLTTDPVKLYDIHKMEKLQQWYPDLKHVSLSFYRSKVDLNDYVKEICDTFTLESLQITYGNAQLTQLPASLWTAQLRAIDIQNNAPSSVNNQKLDLGVPVFFENRLEVLVLRASCTYIEERLFDTPTLKTVRLDDSNGQEHLHKALNLNYLEIIDAIPSPTWWHLPLQTLYLRYCQKLPPLRCLPQLKTLKVEGSYFELENDWDALQNLETLSLKFFNKPPIGIHNPLTFRRLRHLKTLSISQTDLTTQSCHWGALPSLESVAFEAWQGTKLPSMICESAVLKQIILHHCERLTSLPTYLLEHKMLKSLEILNCPALRLSCYWAVRPLQKFQYSGLRITAAQKRHWGSDLMPFLDKIGATKLERLALGGALIEGFENAEPKYLSALKQGFLSLVRVRNLFLKMLLLDNIYFLNPKQTKQPFSNKAQSIHLMGSTNISKSYYETKLKALNFTYHAKLKADTERIIVAGYGIIPDKFWDYPHLFFKESDLEAFLQTDFV